MHNTPSISLTLIIALLSGLISACHKERINKDGLVGTYQEPVWEKPLPQMPRVPFGRQTYSYVWSSVAHKQHFFVRGVDGSIAQTLWQYDAVTGEQEATWTFNDDIDALCQYDSLLLMGTERTMRAVNLVNGTIVWELPRGANLYNVGVYGGLGKTYFRIGRDETKPTSVTIPYLGDMTQPNIQPLDTPAFQQSYTTPTGYFGSTSYVVPITPENQFSSPSGSANDTLLAIYFADATFNWSNRPYLGLYNLSQRKWKYTKQSLIADSTFAYCKWAQAYRGNLYALIGADLICSDIQTGKTRWKQRVASNLLLSNPSFLLVDDRIIAYSSSEIFCYGETSYYSSEVKWTQAHGVGSEPKVHRGIMYYVRTIDNTNHPAGYLCALEIATGKQLRQQAAPEKNEIFTAGLQIIPDAVSGWGRIIVASDKDKIYCFPALR